MSVEPTVVLDDVSLVRDGRSIVDHVSWTVWPNERWVVLGRNGSGKTSLVAVASLTTHPSSGSVTVLGERLGRTDLRLLRRRVAVAAPRLADTLRGSLTPVEIVMTARFAALEPWWHTYDADDVDRARQLLSQVGCAGVADHPFSTLSSGERQRVLLARARMVAPGIVFLDEPTAGLDLGGREDLVGLLGDWATDPTTPPIVLVTHHLEEVPVGTTHALLLADGTIQAAGPIATTLTSDALSRCFGLPLEVSTAHGRWTATARRPG